MKKSIVVCTSTGCLDYYKHEYDIRILRLLINMNNKYYEDGTDMKADQFYNILKSDSSILPTTSQPSPGYLLEFFEKLILEGFEEVFVVTISSQLSGTYSGIVAASKILKDRIKINVFDTKTVTFSEGVFALEAAKMLQEGKSFFEIEKRLEGMREKNTIYFAVNSLEFLVKNGRLSGAAGFIGTMLKIKPLLQVQPSGKIVSIERIRTTKKALEMVCNKVNEYVKGHQFTAYLAYTGNPDLLEYTKEMLKNICQIENIAEVPSTPVIGCHIGYDAIGILLFLND